MQMTEVAKLRLGAVLLSPALPALIDGPYSRCAGSENAESFPGAGGAGERGTGRIGYSLCCQEPGTPGGDTGGLAQSSCRLCKKKFCLEESYKVIVGEPTTSTAPLLLCLPE